jgi:hypothetical protein
MRRSILFLFIQLVLISSALVQTSRIHAQIQQCWPRMDWTRFHTVASGENLFRIGLRYGVRATDLATGNCLGNINRVNAGQVLRVPGGPSTQPGWYPLSGHPIPLYSGPSRSNPILANLTTGSFRPLGRSQDTNWVNVLTSSGLGGWLWSYDTNLHAGIINALPIFGTDSPSNNAYVYESGVRLRAGPGYTYGVKRYLSWQWVQAVGRTGDSSWLKVNVYGADGWVLAAYVRIDPVLVSGLPVVG